MCCIIIDKCACKQLQRGQIFLAYETEFYSLYWHDIFILNSKNLVSDKYI